MKHLIPQTMTAVSVLALALAVGGCGSSSDKDDDKVVTPLVPPTVSAPELMCGAGTDGERGRDPVRGDTRAG